jgi:hypothetical protein
VEEDEFYYEPDLPKEPVKEVIKSPTNPVVIQTWKVTGSQDAAKRDEGPARTTLRTMSVESISSAEDEPTVKTPDFSRKIVLDSDNEWPSIPLKTETITPPSNVIRVTPSATKNLEPTYLPSMLDMPRRKTPPKRV